jgi:PAS domain S-box-containing protein
MAAQEAPPPGEWIDMRAATNRPGGPSLPAPSGPLAQTSADLPVLGKAAEVRHLSPSEAGRQYPVHLRGVVTCYEPEDWLQFVQDDSGGIYFYFDVPRRLAGFRAGEMVEIEGVSHPGDYAPIIHGLRIRRLGEWRMPQAKDVSLRMLLTGQEDSQWVALRGVVRSQRIEGGNTVLSLAADNAVVKLSIPDAVRQPAPGNLVDAAVRVCAVCSTRFDAHRRLKGVQLNTPDWMQVEVERAAPPDPSKLPLWPINELLQFRAGTNGFHRSRVRGWVTLRQSDGSLCVQDGTGGIFVQAGAEAAGVRMDEAIEAVGFATVVDGLPSIQDAAVTRLHDLARPLPVVTPLPLPSESALNEDYHGTLVRLEGRVLSSSSRTREESLTLQFGALIADAILDKGSGTGRALSVAPGSLVAVTGVYLARLDQLGRTRAFELRLRSPGDVVVLSRPFWWTARRVVWTLGSLGGLLVVALAWVTMLRSQVQQRTRELRDEIRERERKEAALGCSEQRWKLLFELAPDVHFLLNTDGLVVDANQQAEKLTGYRREELIGRDLLKMNLLSPESVVRVTEARTVSRRGEPTGPAEYGLRRKDGSAATVEAKTLPVMIDSQRLVLGIARDVTERKALAETQRRLATAVEQSAESIVITDVEGTILYVNPAFERTSGYSRAEAIGKNPRILKSGRHGPAFYREMWAVLIRGEAWHGHFINQRKDGAPYEEDAVITPIRDAAGTITNYVAVQRDVTREVQLGEQLRQSQKMEAIGQLAGGVAHDFNNLLAVIRGNIELVLMGAERLSAEHRECLAHVVGAADRAANLTRQLLAFGRKQVMEPQPLNLNAVVANVVKMLKRIIGEDIHLELNYAPSLPYVQADAGMVEQVLFNLVVNARDAMPAGGRLTLSTEPAEVDAAGVGAHAEARTGHFVCLRVADSGSGIPPEVLPHIFEPFFTTKGVGKGSGLGLATAYGIVKQHRGWIEVASQAGAGSVFKVFLPAIRALSPTAQDAAPIPNPPGGTETILLVEDDEAVRSFTHRLLRSHGYRVQETASGREALERWPDRAAETDLLLTDVVMPGGVTGFDLAERLRAQKPNLKVILMSGYSRDGAARRAVSFEGPNNRFIQKPYRVRDLLVAVRQVLDE